jgi:hypothetical protein
MRQLRRMQHAGELSGLRHELLELRLVRHVQLVSGLLDARCGRGQLRGLSVLHDLRELRLGLRLQFLPRVHIARGRRRQLLGIPLLHDVRVVRLALQHELLHRVHILGRGSGELLRNGLPLFQLEQRHV